MSLHLPTFAYIIYRRVRALFLCLDTSTIKYSLAEKRRTLKKQCHFLGILNML
nr:MAG TPA: hypothetical protein [Caudoviricetes sp.]